jgi:hypothetical protein
LLDDIAVSEDSYYYSCSCIIRGERRL